MRIVPRVTTAVPVASLIALAACGGGQPAERPLAGAPLEVVEAMKAPTPDRLIYDPPVDLAQRRTGR
ncbi:MAG TPA: hypothetical protein VNI61_11590 [Gemmatimonadales bacterium]|nr:hypothetical protein [Gemmatimonadales bacterium]